MPDSLLPLVFQAALGLAAILFGVLGFLYGLYGAFMSRFEATPPALRHIVILARLNSGLIAASAVVAAAAGAVMAAADVAGGDSAGRMLMAALILIVLTASGSGVYIAFRLMR